MTVLIASGTIVNSQDEQFFKAMGARITQARKERNLTQQQVADQLGIAQQTYAHYEVGRIRFPASTLPMLAQAIGLSVEELLGTQQPKGKPGPASRLQKQMERISQLPRTKQRYVSDVLEAVITQASH